MNVNKAFRKVQELRATKPREARKLLHRIVHELAKNDITIVKMGRMES